MNSDSRLRRVSRWARSRRGRAWAIAIVLVVVIGAFRVLSSRRGADVEVTTATITTGPVVRRIVATGTLQALTTVQVGAQVSGTIETLGADYNSIVHAGQIVARLDEADIAGVHRGEPVTFQVESYPNRTFSGTISSIHLQPVIDQTTGASAGATSAATATSPPATSSPLTSAMTMPSVAGSVVSYATIVDVLNADEQLRPGMTATVALTGARRDDTVRVPIGALSFRPPLDVLTAIREPAAVLSAADHATDTTMRRLWRYDGAQFTPIDVRVGLAGSEWTEILEGALRPGDSVVTNASIGHAH